jgi:polysaccharide biosynthesis/export protein
MSHAKQTAAGSARPVRAFTGIIAAAALLACAATLAGCAPDGPSAAAVAAQQTPAPTGDYVIGPGDHLGIFVYEQQQLSVEDLPVRPDGRISTPLVPDVQAAGKTSSQLASALTDRLKQYVRDPKVTVLVRNFVGPFDQQVRVIGEATEPLAIPYRAHMTVLDVLIQTKGLTRFAAGNSAVIVRQDPGKPSTRIPVRLSNLIKDGDISQNVEMRPGDTLIIPQSWF